MDNLPTEILIRIFDKSRLSDQLISHRLINTKFRKLIPTKASRIQRVDSTDLVAMSKKLALFSQQNCAFYYYSLRNPHEDPEVEHAYANLLLYVCHVSGASLKCISFTTPIFLDSETMEKLASMCPRLIEIKVGYTDWRGSDMQLLLNVYQAVPRFPELKILRIESVGDTAFLQPIVEQLRLQKLHTSGVGAPVLTADPSLLQELLVGETHGGPYKEIQNRISDIFPNLHRHYLGKKQRSAVVCVRLGEAEANYRRLRMLRGSSWIGGRNLWFVDERLFLDFSYLQSINVEIYDDGSCDRFVGALQSSRNWKALGVILKPFVSIEKFMQLLRALCYATAVRLKNLTLKADVKSLRTTFMQQFLHFDQAANGVVFDKTLRHCNIRGSGMLLLVAKIANACRQLKCLAVHDFANYTEPESGLQEQFRMVLARFQSANLRSLLKLTFDVAHSTAYNIIQCLSGSKLHTINLFFETTDGEVLADAHCSSLLREDIFPYLRKIQFTTDNKGVLSNMVLNIVRHLPALRSLVIHVLRLTSHLGYPRLENLPTVEFEQTLWRHIADHANLQICSVNLNGYSIHSKDSLVKLYNIISRKKVDGNDRLLPWLHMELRTLYADKLPEQTDLHHQGENAYCFVHREVPQCSSDAQELFGV